MRYGKLVRDGIPEIIRVEGRVPSTRIATDDEYGHKLNEKLCEEVVEFLKSGEQEELADILEVIDAIIHYRRLDRHAIDATKLRKRKERGGFDGRIILEEA